MAHRKSQSRQLAEEASKDIGERADPLQRALNQILSGTNRAAAATQGQTATQGRDMAVGQTATPERPATPRRIPTPDQTPTRPRPATPELIPTRYQKPTQGRKRTQGRAATQGQVAAGAAADPGPEYDLVSIRADYIKTDREVYDVAQAMMEPDEWAVYSRLYRLSYGYRKNTCLVGQKALIRATNVRETTLKAVLKRLKANGWIGVVETVNSREVQGTKYRVYLPAERDPGSSAAPVSASAPAAGGAGNKHDDDFKTPDHRQREVMRIYRELSGLDWTEADTASYRMLDDLPVEQVEQLMRTIHGRRGQQPQQFAFFVKSILKETQAAKMPRPTSAIRKKMETLIAEIRELHVGDRDYQTSDMIADLKDRCAREGISWNNDIVNELLGQ